MLLRIGLVCASLIAVLTAFEPVFAADECAAKQRTCKLDCANRSSAMRMSVGDAVCTMQCVSKIDACKDADGAKSQRGMSEESEASPN